MQRRSFFSAAAASLMGLGISSSVKSSNRNAPVTIRKTTGDDPYRVDGLIIENCTINQNSFEGFVIAPRTLIIHGCMIHARGRPTRLNDSSTESSEVI